MQTEINLFPLIETEERVIMLMRLKLTRVEMAKRCGVSLGHFTEWMKGNRDSAPLQAQLEERYLNRICERKS